MSRIGPTNFPATQWSVVLSAGGDACDASRAALETLCRTYWAPLFSYLRQEGHPPDAAQDLVQGFLARLLERHDFATVAPERGRFRSFLLAGLRHYLVSEIRREDTQKRGGRAITVPINGVEPDLGNEPRLTDSLTPETAFDRHWAQTVIERALERLRHEHEQRGKLGWYEVLKPTLAGEPESSYAGLGTSLGLSEGAVAVAVHRLRQRLRELVRTEVAQTVGTAGDLEEEMRHLMAVWTN
ncbi:MAG TPA: sigma-70 family RNA polymerase sigma factor [Verrucomicrobiota bacterium]|nr:hypothetical protein [Verrucomicrobiales bacterium]HRI12398.1 sigma-70 family RNA polymerase sigma factor [Verrucomicrobiota bacterium]